MDVTIPVASNSNWALRLIGSALVVMLICGCDIGFHVNPNPNPSPNPPGPIVEKFDAEQAAAALARLAERCSKSASRIGSVELDGTLTELGNDGVPAEWIAKVRATCPGIGEKPPRQLTEQEIQSIKGLK